MAYDRTHWKDHVTERARTFIETENEDGSVTHTPAPGEVLQQGTPQSATNFNKIEDALQHTAVAFDWLYCIMQAQEREMQTMKEQLAALV